MPKPPPLEGRTIAVVGGAGGIGRALVRRLLDEGAVVAVLDLPVSLDRHPPPAVAARIPVDLTDPDMVMAAGTALAKLHPTLHGCVNLVGFHMGHKPALAMSDAEFTETLDGNLLGALRWARVAMPLLAAGGQAGHASSLVHVASGLAQYIRPGYAAYAASKAGLIALTKTLALECAPAVRVNAVAPSAIETAFLSGGTGRSDEQQAIGLDRAAYTNSLPLRRFGQPDDVVGPIAFLLGPDSAYMTGQTLWINAGGYMP